MKNYFYETFFAFFVVAIFNNYIVKSAFSFDI